VPEKLAKKIRDAASAYYLGTPTVSDAEYDLLADRLRAIDPEHELLRAVGTDIATTSWPIVKHLRPMGSLHKVNSEEDFRKWAAKYASPELCVSEKLDGLSISLNYEGGKLIQGVTRGDGEQGEDITVNIKRLKGVPHKIEGAKKGEKLSIRGEAILALADYRKHFPRRELEDGTIENANPRNCVACIRRKKDNSGAAHVSFVAYDISSDGYTPKTKEEVFEKLGALGFATPFYKACDVEGALAVFHEYQGGKRAKAAYEIDGLVAEDNDRARFIEAGESSSRPRGARAIKFASETGMSVIRDISWQMGRTGVVTPVSKIDPVVINGVTIVGPSLMNVAECLRLGVRQNATVTVERANDVIPRIIDAEGGGRPFVIPSQVDGFAVLLRVEDRFFELPGPTPLEAKALEKLGIDVENATSIFLFCDDPSHPMRKFRRFENFLAQLDVKGAGERAVQALMDSGKLGELGDYFKLTVADWAEATGSELVAKKIAKEFREKTTGVPLPTFIKSLGMTFFGNDTSKLIESKYPRLEDWFSLTAEDITQIKGIGEAKAKAAVAGLKKNKKAILEMATLVTFAAAKADAEGAVTVCFTGVRLPAELASAFREKGYAEVSGVSKKTQILVFADVGSASGKAQKARELGVALVAYDEFIKGLA
jgi:DNA ligase (NAD+)